MIAMDDPIRLPDGFVERGHNVTRIEAFVDAAFAFAVTLLVIASNSVPTSFEEMLHAMKGVPAFAASFAQIMMFWSAHSTWSRRFGLDDARSQRLSLVMVFLVLVYVYPLKVLFGGLFYWISAGWLPPVAQIHSLLDLKLMFVMYGLAFATLSLCMAGLYREALKAEARPALDPFEFSATRDEILRWRYYACVAVLSMAVALLLPASAPGWMLGVPGLVYALLSFSQLVVRRFGGGVREAPRA
jgi:uncharacterized membrane protein